MNFRRLLYRSWFYFRIGYGTYIALPVGLASNVVVLYELAIIKNKYLSPIFTSLTIFTAVALVVFIPVGILVGLYHMKRTGAFAADASVSIESNPYIYKVVPGKEREVILPLMMLTARGLAKILDEQKTITTEEKREFERVLAKANSLLEGQAVGLQSQASSQRKSTTEKEK